MKAAGFGRRVAGRVIDIFVLLPITATLMFLGGSNRDVSIAIDLISLFLVAGYAVYCHFTWGQTAGKMILGTKVTTEEGGPISFLQALLRSSVEFGFSLLSAAFLIMAKLSISPETYAGLGFLEKGKMITEIMPQANYVNFLSGLWLISSTLVMAFHPQRRALHDLIAGTRVNRLGVAVEVEAAAPVAAPVTEVSADQPTSF